MPVGFECVSSWVGTRRTVTRAPGHRHRRTCAAATCAPPQHPRPPQPPHLEGWGKSGAEAPDPARDAFKLTGTSRRRGARAPAESRDSRPSSSAALRGRGDDDVERFGASGGRV